MTAHRDPAPTDGRPQSESPPARHRPAATGGTAPAAAAGAASIATPVSATLFLLSALIGAAGAVLYFASYFWGMLLIVAGGAAAAAGVAVKNGVPAFKLLLRRAVRGAAIPLIGAGVAVAIGAVLMVATGYDPLTAYRALFHGAFVRNWHVSVLNAAPLIFTGLSVALAFKAGLFNIGAEGQYYIGAMAATWLGIRIGLPPIATIALVFIGAGVAAAAWNLLPALLKVKTGAHEVITTMMLAHTARYLSPIFIRAFGGDPATSTHPYVTDAIADVAKLPRFNSFLPAANYRVHIGILFAVVAAVLVHLLLTRTRLGFEIRAVGLNKDAARTQGISVGRTVFAALLLAGCLAGLAGVNQVLGLDHKLFENLQANYGWNGISVALLAGGHPLGVIFTGLLWGALDAGGQFMSRTTQTPGAVVEIIKGVMLFLMVATHLYRYLGAAIVRLFRRRRPAAAAATDTPPSSDPTAAAKESD